MILNLFKILSDENRLRIYNLLRMQDLCVCEMEALLELNQSNLSRHLSKMKSTGLLDSYKDQQFIYYKISIEFCSIYESLLREIDERLNLEGKFNTDRKNLEIYIESKYSSDDMKKDREGVVNHIEKCKCLCR